MNAIHHHRKARSRSAIAQMWSVIDLLVALGKTTGSLSRGGRTSPRGCSRKRLSEDVMSVIRRHHRGLDWDCGCAPRRSPADACSGRPAPRNRAGSACAWRRRCSGSAMLPKVKACVGQAAWHAVLTSPTGRLSRSAAMRASAMRCRQKVHFSITPRPRTVTSGLRDWMARCSSPREGEIIKSPDLVGTVVGAEPRADATVIHHHVQPFGIVHRCANRTDDLARRLLALHAQHRLEVAYRRIDIAFIVAIDAQPLHLALAQHLLLADDRNVVFGLTGDNARVAADARIQIHAHGPGRRPLRLPAVEMGLFFAGAEKVWILERIGPTCHVCTMSPATSKIRL